MKAIVYRRYGSPDVLELEGVGEPVVKDDVLVRGSSKPGLCGRSSRGHRSPLPARGRGRGAQVCRDWPEDRKCRPDSTVIVSPT